MSKKVERKLNKFEMCRLLAARAGELVHGDKPKVRVKKDEKKLARDCANIAKSELDKDKIELEIYRK